MHLVKGNGMAALAAERNVLVFPVTLRKLRKGLLASWVRPLVRTKLGPLPVNDGTFPGGMYGSVAHAMLRVSRAQ